MRADAAPFIPSVLLNSSTYECTNEKNDERQQQRSQNRRRQRRWREKHGAVVCGKETKSSKPDESRSSIPSNKQQLVEQHRKRRSRRRRRNQRRNSSNDDDQSSSARPDTTHTDDVVDYNEECFPTLLTSDYTVHHNNKPHADTSWGESLAKKLATSLELEQQQTNHRVQNNSDEDDDEFGVQLNSDVQLTKLSRSRATNVTLSSGLQEVDIDQTLGIEIAQNENVALQFNDDENDNCALVTNVRWKWNDAQLSKMRQRWWNAVREQQKLTDENKKRFKAVKSEHSTYELSDGSSISSDASSLLSIEDDDDHLQPPSLSQPFDENPTPQIDDINWSPRVPKAVLELEEACCETDYPLHAIIYLHALQNPFIDDKGNEDTAQASTKPDSVVVLQRLLALEDHDSVQQWRMKRIGLDKLSKFRNPPVWVKNLVNEIEQIASADNEMTPLQLAITLNCPDIIRLVVSGTMASYGVHNKSENEQGCTPLMLACELGRIACIKALLCSLHVKLDYRERRGGNTCYHYCCLNQNNGVAALDTLMSHTTNTTQKRVLLSTNREGRTLLHLACARGDLPLLKSLLGHLSNISSQLPWKALTMNDRLGHNPFISAVYANECEIVEHLLLTRFAGADYTSWFSACPLTIASSNLFLDMAKLLFEMGYDTRSTTNPNFSPIIRYDVNRSLLELMLVSIDDDDEVNTDKHELIGLLIEHGANPLSAVNVFTPNKPKTRGDNGIAALSTEEETPLSVAVVARDYLSIECMLHSYTHALTVTQSSRRKDPILISQPESYFRAVEERETDMVHSSLQSALVKALFITWQQNGDHAMGKCCLALYRRGVALSQLSMQWLEKCLLMERLIPPLTIRDDSTEKYYFEAPHVQYSLPNASGGVNPVSSADTKFLCWSHILLSLPWVVNKFAFNCNWIRNVIDSDFDPGELKNDEIYLVVEEGTRLLVHRSIISARSGKLAAAIRFAEAQEKYNDDEGGTISIIIDLPLLIAKMLICHCYHGSISFGLMTTASPLKRCEQLLELALVAEEYLLPSLITEVEMRLLDTKGNDDYCFCAYCSGASLYPCDAVECPVTRQCLTLSEENIMPTGVYFQKASHSNTISQSSLISPGSSLSILAVTQQLEQSSSSQSGSYLLKYIKCQESVVNSCIDVEKDVNAGTIDTPFFACKAVAVYTLLREFKVFMHLANTESDDIPTLIDIENIDDTHILLLRTCLEELAQSPFRRKDFHNGPTNLSSRWMHYKNESGKA